MKMMEPSWNQTARQRKNGRPARTRNERPGLTWLVDAAPYAVAAVWVTAILAALIGGAATGRRELLDWCRSDVAITMAGTLAGIAALVGSLRSGVRR
jgi:hypothetical protein